jgi:hypothetical protein
VTRTTRPAVAFLAACGLLAAAGGTLAVRSVVADDGVSIALSQRVSTPAAHAGPHGVGDDVLTSFGAASVDVVKKIPGLTSKAVGGVTHYPSYIPPEKMQVQVTVTVTNLTPAIFPVEPSKLFRLVSADGKEIVATTSNFMRTIPLQPSASLEGVLGFIVPAKGQKLQVRVTDPGASAQIVEIGPATADPTGRKSATPMDHSTDTHTPRSGRP